MEENQEIKSEDTKTVDSNKKNGNRIGPLLGSVIIIILIILGGIYFFNSISKTESNTGNENSNIDQNQHEEYDRGTAYNYYMSGDMKKFKDAYMKDCVVNSDDTNNVKLCECTYGVISDPKNREEFIRYSQYGESNTDAEMPIFMTEIMTKCISK